MLPSPRPWWYTQYQPFVNALEKHLSDFNFYRFLVAHLFCHVMDGNKLELDGWMRNAYEQFLTRGVIQKFIAVHVRMFPELSPAQQERLAELVSIGGKQGAWHLRLVHSCDSSD